MCLIVVAHRISEAFPLVIAANRDEAYERPTLAAHFWTDDPDVAGGRDLREGGSWLAITRTGRVAAVTNLRGEAKPGGRSRGFLVRDFVTSSVRPWTYATEIENHAADYAGFHLIVGTVGGTLVHLEKKAEIWSPGVWGMSNGPVDARWEKVERGVASMRNALAETSSSGGAVNMLTTTLLAFLQTRTGESSLEREIFVVSERYGTRSSTVIVATADEIAFTEQSYGVGGKAIGEPRSFRFPRLNI